MATRPMQVWNGTAWEDIGPQAPATAIVVQSSTPTGDSGKLWIDTSADVPTYASMAPTASPSFTGTSTFAGPVTMSGGSVSMSGATSVTGGGMDLITPTSVAGSGVTLSGGEVSFSAATTVSVNGCFTSTYQNYQVLIAYSVSASAFVNSRYRSAGTDDSASNYFQQYLSAVNTAVGGLSSTATSQYTAFAASTDPHYSVVQISGPNLAAQTSLLAANLRSDGIMHFSCKKNTTTQYDGFSLIPASGTVTGTLRIYGLRNS